MIFFKPKERISDQFVRSRGKEITPIHRSTTFIQQWGTPLAVSLATLTAVLLPLSLLATQRFHHDEALYATWGLTIASGEDVWLTNTPIDKPPLFLYLLAGVFRLVDATETTARLPSLLATAIIVLLTFGLGRSLYSSSTGLLAAWLVALSPFTILFAPTAFTDPLLVALVLASCLAAAHGQAGWAGIFLALAAATKQQGVLFIPLITGMIFINHIPLFQLFQAKSRGSKSPHILRLMLFFLLTLLLALLWDFSRAQPSAFFRQSSANYGGLSIDFTGLGERGIGFLELLYYGTGSPPLNLLCLIGLPLLLGYGFVQIFQASRASTQPSDLSGVRVGPQADWLLVLFILAFLFLHSIFSFQVWDRYLLGLIPLLTLLMARVLLLPLSILNIFVADARLAALTRGVYAVSLIVLLGVNLLHPVQDAVQGRYPLGSNSRAVAGIEQIAAFLQGNIGADTTLYHRWLGAYWRFYLWNYPYDLIYWDNPQELAAKAKPDHLIAFPTWRSDTELRLALYEVGLSLREVHRAYRLDGAPSIILYQIESARTR